MLGGHLPLPCARFAQVRKSEDTRGLPLRTCFWSYTAWCPRTCNLWFVTTQIQINILNYIKLNIRVKPVHVRGKGVPVNPIMVGLDADRRWGSNNPVWLLWIETADCAPHPQWQSRCQKRSHLQSHTANTPMPDALPLRIALPSYLVPAPSTSRKPQTRQCRPHKHERRHKHDIPDTNTKETPSTQLKRSHQDRLHAEHNNWVRNQLWAT